MNRISIDFIDSQLDRISQTGDAELSREQFDQLKRWADETGHGDMLSALEREGRFERRAFDGLRPGTTVSVDALVVENSVLVDVLLSVRQALTSQTADEYREPREH